MGLLDKVGKFFGDETNELGGLFLISTRLDPFRLNSRTNNFVDLTVTIKNISNKDLMVSAMVACPRELGVTSTSVQKKQQEKLGTIEAGEEKKAVFRIYAFSTTPARDYQIPVVVYSHFRDYEHVENAARKMITLRAV